MILKLFQQYFCIKCKKEINVNSLRSGRIPELCKDCKREKELLDSKVRQKRFYLRKVIKQELGI